MSKNQNSVSKERINIDVHGGSACRAFESDGAESTDEYRLDPLIEARLTEIVQRLRRTWIYGPAGLWTDIHAVREASVADIDKRVTTTLARGFLQFSQFLAGFEVLVLELEKSGVVSEQSLLGLEQFLHDRGCFFADESAVSDG